MTEVLDLSLSQVRQLVDAVLEEERRQNKRWLVLLRAAEVGGDGFDKTIRAMG